MMQKTQVGFFDKIEGKTEFNTLKRRRGI